MSHKLHSRRDSNGECSLSSAAVENTISRLLPLGYAKYNIALRKEHIMNSMKMRIVSKESQNLLSHVRARHDALLWSAVDHGRHGAPAISLQFPGGERKFRAAGNGRAAAAGTRWRTLRCVQEREFAILLLESRQPSILPHTCIQPAISRRSERKFRAGGGEGAANGERLSARRDPATFRGQLADQPIGLQRVGEPGLGPAALDAGLD